MINCYLYIQGNEWNYYDGVFSGIATVPFDKVSSFCIDKAETTRHSDWGNYSGLSKKKRERIAKLWEAAKDLPEGKYEYYFNIEDKKESFKNLVKDLAERMGIKYELILK